MPMYANTHTLQSGTGKQTNNAREEARAIIKRVCGGNEKDALIFVGAGATVSLLTKNMIIVCCEPTCL
jgi:selenocysteine lyase/cysteine desulfurase